MFDLYIPIAIIVLLVIFIIISISNSVKLKKISKHCKNGNLAQTITTYYNNLEKVSNNICELSNRFQKYEKDNQNSFQRISIVKFDAFKDISGKLSFSLAILNQNDNGIVLTSLYGHDTSNMYIREITAGKTDVHLMDEEKEALEKAKGTYNISNA